MSAQARGYVKIHPGVVRLTHWINVVAMAIMIGSGWRIWNSSPIFDYSFPVAVTIGGDPALSQEDSAARATAASPPRSTLRREIGSIRGSEKCLLMVGYNLHTLRDGLIPFFHVGTFFVSEDKDRFAPQRESLSVRSSMKLLGSVAGGAVRRYPECRQVSLSDSAGDAGRVLLGPLADICK